MHPRNIEPLLEQRRRQNYRLYSGIFRLGAGPARERDAARRLVRAAGERGVAISQRHDGHVGGNGEKSPRTCCIALKAKYTGPMSLVLRMRDATRAAHALRPSPAAQAPGRRDHPHRPSRVPRPRVPPDGADRRAGAERRPRRRDPQPPDAALARQPVPRARAFQEGRRAGLLRRAVLARRAGRAGARGQRARRRLGAADEEPVPRVPRQHHRPRDRDHAERGALLRRLRRLAPGRAERRDRPRPVVGAERRPRDHLPQGHRRPVGGAAAAVQAHPRRTPLPPLACADAQPVVRTDSPWRNSALRPCRLFATGLSDYREEDTA